MGACHAGGNGCSCGRRQLPANAALIAAVGEESAGFAARPADTASYRQDQIDEREQLGDVGAVAAGQRLGQKKPATIGQEMVLLGLVLSADRGRRYTVGEPMGISLT